ANLTLGTAAGVQTFTIANNSTTGGQLLTIAGGVSSGWSSTKTLTVTGAGNTEINGVISTGSATTFALTKSGIGTLTLKGANTFGGTVTVNTGTLKVDAGAGGVLTNALTLGTAISGGTFIYDNTTAVGSSDASLGPLTFVSGSADNTIQLTRTALQTNSLTFSSLSTSASLGATVNFVLAGTPGVNGTDSKIVFTGKAAGFFSGISQPLAYFNGSSFAWYDGGGYVRGINYGVDANSATSSGTAFGNGTHQEVTGSITGQGAATLGSGAASGTLKISGANDITVSSGQLKVTGPNSGTCGILKAGGGTGTIYGDFSLSIQGAGMIRTDGATDVLVIDAGINSSGSKTRLVKSGAGTLILKGASSWGSGVTNEKSADYINGGTWEIADSGTIFTNNTLTIGGGALFKYNSNAAQSLINVVSGEGNVTVNTGTLTLAGANTFSGQLTVEGGTLAIATINNASANGVLGNSALSVILGKSSGGTGALQFTGTNATYSSSKPFTLTAGGTGGFDVTNSATTLTLSGAISGGGGLAKSGAGTLAFSTLAKSYTGDTTVSDGTLKLSVASTLDDNSSLKNVTGTGKTPKVELASGVTETVNAFYVDGKQQAKGTWGAPDKTGVAQTSAYFSGDGVLDVKTGASAGTRVLVY
ncbi:MAG: autotransporter-associated beta strand repeat-containing protein, partial [bacterium]